MLLEQVSLREQYTKSKDSITKLVEETKEHKTLIEKEKELEKHIVEYKEQVSKKLQEEKSYEQKIAGENKLIADTNTKIERIKSLGRESNCPTCTRPLLDEYDNVLASLEDIVKQSKREKIAKLQEELQVLADKRVKEEEKFSIVNHDFFVISKSINLIESKKRDLVKEEEHFEKVKAHGLKNKNELEKLSSFVYDKVSHEAALEKQKELKSKYENVLALETMLLRLDKVQDDLNTVTLTINDLSKKYDTLELEYKSVNYDEVKHKEKEKEFAEVKKQKEEQSTFLNNLKVQIATINGQVQTIQQSLDDNTKQLSKVQTKKDDLKDYDKIKISLGEFKTKLNSKVAPRISSFASNMYALITKGKYQHIEVSNDFDFFIYDEGKKYPIERFSGGEVDLANLVLRIAISKTLAELSGTSSVGFLAFDEVFGSQDEARRLEILEAFHTIKEQYRQIFLISHEMEIKEMFESVVEL